MSALSSLSSAAGDAGMVTDQATGRLPTIDKKMSPDKIRKTAEDFEAVFIAEMFKPMFDTISTEGMFSGGAAEGIWRSMMVQEFGKSVAQQGGLGLADHIQAAMLRMQETQS